MIYEYECRICHKRFEEFRCYKERENAFHCGEKAIKLIASRIFTDDDLTYKFDAAFFGNNPINIYSRKQYKKLLKKHGFADATAKDCLSVKKKTESDFKPQRQKKVAKIMKRLGQEGLTKHLKPCFAKHLLTKQ